MLVERDPWPGVPMKTLLLVLAVAMAVRVEKAALRSSLVYPTRKRATATESRSATPRVLATWERA
jgi:hypothetical protein